MNKKKKSQKSEDEVVELNIDYVKQKEEMKKLYGEGTERVVQAETEMQEWFDKMCAEKSPILWPCLPLNMKFD